MRTTSILKFTPWLWLSGVLGLVSLSLSGCRNPGPGTGPQVSPGVEFARGFILEANDSTTTLIIREADSSTTTYVHGPQAGIRGERITLPIDRPLRLVCLSSTHLGFLASLGREDQVVGISGAQYIYHTGIRQRIEQGQIIDVGYPGAIDYERLLALKPDLILSYNIDGAGYDFAQRMREFGLPVMTVGEHRESLPLGRMEWIKVFGFLTGSEAQADSIYRSRRDRYQKLAERVATKLSQGAPRPSALVNWPYRETWYIPGQESFLANFVRDAGGLLALSETFPDSYSHAVNYEIILEQGPKAEIWLNPGRHVSIATMRRENPSIAGFRSIIQEQIFNNNLRLSPSGGNDFFESGVMHPDEILADLIQIFHPELIDSSRTMIYHHRLPNEEAAICP